MSLLSRNFQSHSSFPGANDARVRVQCPHTDPGKGIRDIDGPDGSPHFEIFCETPMTADEGEVTTLLAQLNRGDERAMAQLMPLVYQQLRDLAAGFLKRERIDHTLQPTALVHEAYVKLVGQRAARWESSGQFLALAATAMRRILVDHARSRGREKRGGRLDRVPLSQATACDETGVDLVALDDSLNRLAVDHPRKAKVVELRYFVGLEWQDVARAAECSLATVKRDWEFAKLWLLREMKDDEPQR